jgi:predicted ATPase
VFRSLSLVNWRQFSSVEVAFHPRLTILTGANGSGKTTILHLLNRHWGWNLNYVSTPIWDKKGIRKYWAGFWSAPQTAGDDDATTIEPIQGQREIGTLTYTTGNPARLRVPENVAEVFAVEIEGQQEVRGVYVPSHRPPYVFQRVDQIATQLDAKQQIFQVYLNELKARFAASQKTQSPSFRIKSALISLATFGYGNKAVDRNEEAVRMFEGFERVLRTVLPPQLGFERLRVRVPDVILKTASGDFSFDAVSGGVASIIDLTWQIFMYAQLYGAFVVVIDEPETHLHPALQRRLLPDLLAAFPECQFVIATHNPFMVTSVPDANVYVLTYNDRDRVESAQLEDVDKAASADAVLRDVLGVPNTLPVWADQKLQELVAHFAKQPLTDATLATLRSQMREVGLEKVFPAAAGRVLEEDQ